MKTTHGPPLRHGPLALAGRTGAVFGVGRFGGRVTRSGLVGAADVAGHLGSAAAFSRTLWREAPRHEGEDEGHLKLLLWTPSIKSLEGWVSFGFFPIPVLNRYF